MRERKQKKGEKKLIKNKWGIIGAAVVLTASLAGAGFWYAGHSENKPSDEKTASEKEIENINPRDNVLDESEAFEGKIPSLKEKKQLKDAEKKKASSKKQEDAKTQNQTEKNETSGESTEITDKPGSINKPENIEKPGSSNKPENTDQQESTDKPEVPEKPGDTEQPETPEQSKPEKPQLPQVQEPGWTIGIY
ncbi:hypothetical protein LIZ09_03795 [Tyzzerella nexilis]|nr:hypothetical protein [[Clostridium] nexile]MCB7556568.1 hypothetical protein [[Clostridium] nexile]MCC3674673.1 hypothetical protein [[Clostridium] nexile]NSD84958.1 hypothetical protein [[Clostridium] nexile]NSD87295.1 hypothetical protein [[Clostridium] nexile]